MYLLEMLNDTKDNDPYHFKIERYVFIFFPCFYNHRLYIYIFFTVCITNTYVISVSNNSHTVTADKIQMCYIRLQLSENHPVRS